MPCLIALLAVVAPRLTILLVVVFSDYIGRAYDEMIWPFLGFFFMPLTTLSYAWAINSAGAVDGIHLVVVIIAVLADLGIIGGSAASRSERRLTSAS